MTTNEDIKRGPGRPATGVTPKWNLRVPEELKQETERMAVALAEHMGFDKPNVSEYVRQALIMENARVTKLIAKARTHHGNAQAIRQVIEDDRAAR